MSAALARQLLWTHINERAAAALFHGQAADRITQTPRDAEVGDLHLATLIDHQVGRFQIPMNDARPIMRVLRCVANLARPSAQFGWLENLVWLVTSQTCQCIAVDKLHRNAARPFVLNEVVKS